MSAWHTLQFSTLQLADDDATRSLGARIGRLAERGGCFIGLVGDLGAGKTTFAQGLVDTLSDGKCEASSPTYTLHQQYDTTPVVHHFDLYRLDDLDDLENVGFWEHADEPGCIVLVEWLDRIPEAWPNDGIVVELEHRANGRTASIYAGEKWFEDIVKLA